MDDRNGGKKMRAAMYARFGNYDQIGSPDRKMVEQLRREYPADWRRMLDEMDDAQASMPGTQEIFRGMNDSTEPE